MMIQEKVTSALVGGTGLGASFLIENANVPDVTEGSSLVSVIVQLVIGIVTLVGLLRKKKV